MIHPRFSSPNLEHLFMDIRSIMIGAFHCERVGFRYSPEPNPGRITMSPKQQGHGLPLCRTHATRHAFFLPVAAVIA
ncbi:MAG TPA: hypothetical protein VE242_00860, partial [Chthoniobacterales bacterium]|nr:hypothetical protein [Chthoniobacterales bacterium]